MGWHFKTGSKVFDEDSGVLLTLKRAAFGVASSGDNEILAAVATKKLRIVSLFMLCTTALNMYFTSGASGTVICGGSTNKMSVGATGGFVLPFDPFGHFETVAGQNLTLNIDGAVSCSGVVHYLEV